MTKLTDAFSEHKARIRDNTGLVVTYPNDYLVTRVHIAIATLVKARSVVDKSASPQHSDWADELDQAINSLGELT